MATRLLMIEESPLSMERAAQVARADFGCDRAELATFDPATLARCTADLVVIVARPAGAAARALLAWLKAHRLSIPTLAVLPEEPDADLFRAAAEAVDDFVRWPVHACEWRERIVRLVGAPDSHDSAVRDLVSELGIASLVGRAPSFVRSIVRIPTIARSGSPVLITGETGTGKELCARAVHHLGPRARGAFIPVDCGALPDHLFENELFGHVKGAFTDARGDQKGLVAMADGGTLFLDEVDALPLHAQAKLLRFLQERIFKPLGADRFQHANVNVLAATNGDLDALVREQRFRADLYFRLNVLALHLVPLRSRREDIPLLCRHFVATICREQQVGGKTVSPLALGKLTAYDWPGNVRELYNVVQRAVVLSEGDAILAPHVTIGRDADAPRENAQSSFRQARVRAVEAFERNFVEELMRQHSGNITRAAREAQKDRRAFGRLVKKYGLRTTPR